MLSRTAEFVRIIFYREPAALFDNTSPNWLPTKNPGHSKVSRKRVATCLERYQRKRRFGWLTDQAQQTSQSKAGLVDGTCNDASNDDSSEPTDDQQAEHVFPELQTDLTSQDILQMQHELITAYLNIVR